MFGESKIKILHDRINIIEDSVAAVGYRSSRLPDLCLGVCLSLVDDFDIETLANHSV